MCLKGVQSSLNLNPNPKNFCSLFVSIFQFIFISNTVNRKMTSQEDDPEHDAFKLQFENRLINKRFGHMQIQTHNMDHDMLLRTDIKCLYFAVPEWEHTQDVECLTDFQEEPNPTGEGGIEGRQISAIYRFWKRVIPNLRFVGGGGGKLNETDTIDPDVRAMRYHAFNFGDIDRDQTELGNLLFYGRHPNLTHEASLDSGDWLMGLYVNIVQVNGQRVDIYEFDEDFRAFLLRGLAYANESAAKRRFYRGRPLTFVADWGVTKAKMTILSFGTELPRDEHEALLEVRKIPLTVYLPLEELHLDGQDIVRRLRRGV